MEDMKLWKMRSPTRAILTLFIFASFYISPTESQVTATNPVLSGNRFLTHAIEAQFQCTSSGNPQPQIRWKLDTSYILQGMTTELVPFGNGVSNVTSTLTFLPIYIDDGKLLYCEVSQSGLSTALSTSVVLDISYYPLVSMATRSYQVLNGMTVTLLCSVQSLIPIIEVYWRKTVNGFEEVLDSSLVQNSNRYDGVTLLDPSLTIFNVVNSDVGSYVCYARTNAGMEGSSTAATLSIVSISVGSTQYSATEGDTITLQCSVNGLSSFSLLWYKDNQVLAIGGKFQNANPTTPSLTISPVAIGDAGTYICSVVTGPSTVNSSNINLAVQVADSISVSLPTTQYTAFTGNSVKIRCDVQSTSLVSAVYWTKSSGSSTQYIYSNTNSKYGDATPSDPSLTINNIATTDAGTYVCYALTASGLTGQSTNAAILNVIASLPTLIVSSLYYTENAGNSVILNCDVNSNGQSYSVTWYFNSAIVSVTGRFSGATSGSPSLRISNIQSSDQGLYICSASTSGGTQNSSAISLSVLQQAFITIPNFFYSSTVGDSVTLQCVIDSGSQTYTVNWYYNNALVGVSGRYSGSLYGSPSLQITNVQLSDAGSYICSATTNAGTRNSSAISLSVAQPTNIFIPSYYYSQTVGDDVILQCSVDSGSQAYSVNWYYNGALIFITGRLSGATFGSPSLRITNVQLADAGSYVCSASATSGGARNSSTITLVVQQVSLPTVTVPNLYYTALRGELVTLECNIYSTSISYSVTWYFIDQVLDISGRFSGGISGNPSLTISSAYAADSGLYICSASNPGGSRNGSAISLTVSQPVTFIIPNQFYSETVGDDVLLYCEISTGGPQISYTVDWYFNGAKLSISGRYSGATYNDPSLAISNVQSSDAGSYICSATISTESKNSSVITLSVQQARPIVTAPAISGSYTKGDNLTLSCEVDAGNSVYNVTWYHDNFVVLVTGRFSGSRYGNPSLTITNVQLSDSGSYVCSASNSGGASNSSALNLNVDELLPTVTVSTFFYQRTVGESVTLRCTVDAQGQSYTVNWYFNNIILSSSISSRYSGGTYLNPSLTISNIATSDAGSYICSASTTSGTRNSSIVTLGVDNPPPTIVIPTNFYSPNIGESVTLTCTVSSVGSASYSVTWYFNGGFLSNTGRTSGGFFGNPSLTISNVQTSDSGTYICSASNSAGSRNGTSISMNVQAALPTVTVSSLFYSPALGDTLTLVCSVQASNTGYSVTWYYNNVVRIVNSGRYSGGIFGSPSLIISNVQSSDTGSYICSASTSAGSTNSSSISVNVQQVLPSVSISTFFYQPSLGDTVTLQCSVSASGQTYSVTWYFNNVVILSNSGRYSGGIFGNPSLTITNVQSIDTGSYVCSAATSAGSRNGSTISLNIQSIVPTITVNTNFYQPQYGASVTLQCGVQASGQTYSVQWYFNNAILVTNTGRYSGGSFGNPSLTITNAQPSDTGSYICSASTSAGSRNSTTISLNINQVMPEVTIPTNFYQPQVGETVTMDCSVQASGQTYTVTWYYNNVIISTNTGRSSGGVFGNPSLTITNAQLSDTGSYICSAATSAGSRNGSTISLNVQQILPTVTVSSVFYQPKVGETVNLQCSVQASGQTYTVQWYYNNAILVTNSGRYSGAAYGNPSLTITNVQRGDTGSYICSAATSAGSRNASTISVNVQNTLPIVTVVTFFYQPKVGEAVTLECNVQASGQAYTVQWYYNNAILATNIGRYSGGSFGNPSLTITNVQTSDTGSYICSAATSAGSRNGSTISVNVQEAIPVVTVTTFYYQAKVTETVTLDCDVQASGQTYTVRWYYNNALLNTNTGRYSGAIFGNPSLTITNAQISDTGSYVCSAATSAGSRNGSTISVNVQQTLPVVTVRIFFYQPKVAETVTLDCSVEASGQTYTVQWYYDNAVLATNSGRYSGASYGNPSLTITNVQTSDTGSYVCSAATSAGSRNGSTITVNVQQILPTVTVLTYFYQLRLGDAVTLECGVEASGQAYTVQWYFNNGILSTSAGRYSGASYGNPSLTITNTQLSDSGSYICSAATSAGSRNGTSISVNVQAIAPTVTVPSLYYLKLSAESVTLDCNVVALGMTYTVTWYYNNAPLSSSGRFSGGSYATPSLTITNLQTSDTGTYVCSAVNAGGIGNSSVITLTVQSSLPTVTVSKVFYNPSVADSVTIDCTVQTSGQTYTVQWYYNSAALTTNTGRYTGGVSGNPSLTIANLQTTDSGAYICSAATSGGSRNSSTVTVTVQQTLPTVTVPAVFYNPRITESVTLDCNVQASGQTYTVTWYYNNALLGSNTGRYSGASFGSPSLTISNLQTSDSGAYICSAATSAGSRNASTITLSVQATLPVVSVSSFYYQPKVTESVTLNCSVQAVGQSYTVTWYYNNAILNTNSATYSGASFGNPSLTISDIRLSDSGSYICSAATPAGSRNSSTITLSVQQILPTVTVPAVTYQPNVQDSVILTCDVQASGQSYTVTWYYNNGILDTNIGRYSGGTFGTPSLSISSVQTSDSGSYVCSAATSAGSRNASTITVSVQQILATVSVPVVLYTPQYADSVTLECSVNAFGQSYTVVWYYNNAVLPISGRFTGASSGNPSLSISNLQMSDTGSYICSASTARGSRNGTVINVSVQEILPTVTAPQTLYQINGGESVTLECSVNAGGLAYTVTWYLNGAILSPNTGRFSGGVYGTPSFTISNSQRSDSGSYICSASTAAGSRNSSTISLSVQQSLPTVTVSTNYYQPVIGNAVTLDCSVAVVAGVATYTVTWYYNGAMLPITGRYSGGVYGNPSLTISNLLKTDDGAYICSASNVGGSRNSSVITVNVLQYPPTNVRITPSTLTVDEGSAITLTCNATGSPTPVYSWSQGQRSWTGPQMNIQSSSSSDEAVYTCTATNAAGSNTATASVFVHYIPRVNIPLYSYSGVQGLSLSIPCTYSASPDPYSITWSKIVNGQAQELIIPGQNNKYSGGGLLGTTSGYANLTINSLDVGDEGTYKCSVTNNKGTGSSIDTTVSVAYAPRNLAISPSAALITEPEFSNVVITCTAEGYPTPVITWSHGSQIYTSSTLRFDNAPRSRNGVYTCRAVNSVGTATATTYLNLQYSPDIIVTTAESSITTTVGSSITLECKTDANPVASLFEWTFNGNTFSRTEPELIISVTESSFGDYRCKASNNLGVSASHLFTVSKSTATGGTGNIGQATGVSTGLSAGELAAIIIACLFILLLILLICFCCYYKGVCAAICGKKEVKGKVEPQPMPIHEERKIEIPRFHEVPSIPRKYPSRDPSFVSRQDVDIGQIREEEFEINTTYRLVPPASTMGGTIISLKDGTSPRTNRLPALDYTYDEYEQKKRRRKKKKRKHHREAAEGMESPARTRRSRRHETSEVYVNGDTYQSVYEDGNLVVSGGDNYFYEA